MAGRIAYLGNIATQGLVLNLDAAIKGSYPGTGSIWTDVSNNGNNGTLTNGPTFSSADYGSIVFDGTNDYVDITNNSNLNFGTSNFTSNVWIYPNTSSLITDREYGIINKNSGYQNFPGWGLELSTYGYSGSFPVVDIIGFNSGQTTWGNALVGNPIKTETWSNINLVRNGSRFDLYTNGSPSSVTTGSNVGFDTNNSANLTLAKNGSWQSSFKGNIANTQIYNQALTQFQVWQNFNAYKSRYGIPDIVTDGLVLNLDAGNPYSYLSGSSGTTWSNVAPVSSSISGSLINGTTYSNGAMTLDGIDDYVQIGTSAVINESLPCTVSVWFKLTELVSGKTPPFCFKTDTGANLVFIIGVNSSGYQGTTLIVPGASAARKTDTDTSFFLNNWVNVLITYNGSGASTPSNYGIYENAVLKTQNTGVGGVADPRLNTTLGYVNSNNVLKGSISATQIYNRALSQAEITQNFNALRGRYGI